MRSPEPITFHASAGSGQAEPSLATALDALVTKKEYARRMESTARKPRPAAGRTPSRPSEEELYPVEGEVGEDLIQTLIAELLRPLIERWYASRGEPRFVGADQYIYYKRGFPAKVVAPDLYDLPGVEPGRRIRSWRVWQTGIVPEIAIEIVSSSDPYKDYNESPPRYAELGVKELIVFDPDYDTDPDRVRWQRFRRLKRRGFVRVEHSNGDRIGSRVLGCWLRVVGEGDAARLRLGTGPAGDDLFPTAEEAERAAKEAARAAEDRERGEKEAALARVAELEALLAERGRPAKGSP
jgi:Uma2 family endonuclease